MTRRNKPAESALSRGYTDDNQQRKVAAEVNSYVELEGSNLIGRYDGAVPLGTISLQNLLRRAQYKARATATTVEPR